MMRERRPLVAVVGPTGSGKSELALRIAGEHSGEIVNCDSLQLYRHLDVGTAKLGLEERRGIPHHLLDVLDPDQVFTAGDYARAARAVLAGVTARGRVPVVAGGTGFYLSAMLEGLFSGPQRDQALRARLVRRERRRPGWLHALLARCDPPSARRIHAADTQKLVRAVEVLMRARRPLSGLLAEGRDALEGYRVLKLGIDPPRDDLYARLDTRCARMFERGLLDEVGRVLAMGFPPDSKALEAHGYRQAVRVLRGETALADAIVEAQRNTRHYAKRQWTWFRRDPGVIWLRGFGSDQDVERAALKRVREFLQDASRD
jgi:tRNA dimethylallyltransferase